jgi:hypothetical protein
MLTFEDCIALSDLTDEEIAAIAEHEHLPLIVAAEFGNYLIHCADGVPRMKQIIADDIVAADRRGDHPHALALKLVLRHFVEHHAAQVQRGETRLSKKDHVVREFFRRVPRTEATRSAASAGV